MSRAVADGCLGCHGDDDVPFIVHDLIYSMLSVLKGGGGGVERKS